MFCFKRWLIESILRQFDTIHDRVTKDVAAQKEEEREEKNARRERIRKSVETGQIQTENDGRVSASSNVPPHSAQLLSEKMASTKLFSQLT